MRSGCKKEKGRKGKERKEEAKCRDAGRRPVFAWKRCWTTAGLIRASSYSRCNCANDFIFETPNCFACTQEDTHVSVGEIDGS